MQSGYGWPAQSSLDFGGVVSVVDAVRRDLVSLGGDLGESALAATALALAAELDDPGNSATSKSMCARALNETMERLRALVPEEPAGKVSKLDELRARRAARGSA